jgi:hypothetical protein
MNIFSGFLNVFQNISFFLKTIQKLQGSILPTQKLEKLSERCINFLVSANAN